jgi:hypothetical protein
MFPEAERPRGECYFDHDILSVAIKTVVQVSYQPGSRWAEDWKPELLDVGGLGVVATSRRDDSSTPQAEVCCGFEA